MRHIARLMGAAAVLREGEGGSGAGGAGGAGGSGDGSAWTAPQGLPAEYAGASAQETLDKLLPAFTETRTRADGLRDQLARLPKAPDAPDKYTFTPSEKLRPFFSDPANNPALNHFRAAAHKAGVPDAAFGQIIEEVYGPMIEGGLIQPPYDPKAELASYGKHSGVDEATAKAHVLETVNFAKGLAGQLQLPAELAKDGAAALEALTDTAGGIAALRAIQQKLAASGFQIPAGSTPGMTGELSDEEWQRLGSDPRIDPRNEGKTDPAVRFDPALRARYDAKSAVIGRTKKYGGTQ